MGHSRSRAQRRDVDREQPRGGGGGALRGCRNRRSVQGAGGPGVDGQRVSRQTRSVLASRSGRAGERVRPHQGSVRGHTARRPTVCCTTSELDLWVGWSRPASNLRPALLGGSEERPPNLCADGSAFRAHPRQGCCGRGLSHVPVPRTTHRSQASSRSCRAESVRFRVPRLPHVTCGPRTGRTLSEGGYGMGVPSSVLLTLQRSLYRPFRASRLAPHESPGGPARDALELAARKPVAVKSLGRCHTWIDERPTQPEEGDALPMWVQADHARPIFSQRP